MDEVKINKLKEIAAQASKAHDDEKCRLAAAGIKSQARYELLKPLKAAADAAHAEYVKYAHGQIKRELNKIIREDAPIRAAAARARSPWKMATYQSTQAAQ